MVAVPLARTTIMPISAAWRRRRRSSAATLVTTALRALPLRAAAARRGTGRAPAKPAGKEHLLLGKAELVQQGRRSGACHGRTDGGQLGWNEDVVQHREVVQ